MGQSLGLFCRRYGHTRLLDEWDAERNLPLTPETVTYGSHTAVRARRDREERRRAVDHPARQSRLDEVRAVIKTHRA